ncbi:MAG: terpene cyclase/mutase family protein [Akkermansiaceae bacterium]|nr:terpene cyclase/mutase family protein [Akkermansiaceae bacterium]
MSIHAHLSEEAQARLNAQRRNSTISSVIISVLVIVLIFLVLGFFLLPNIIKENPTIVTYAASLDEENEKEVKKVNTQIQRKPSAPSNSMTKVIAANTVSPTAIPVPEIDIVTPNADFGDGEDFGGGWGDGGAGGGAGGFAGIPATMRSRCSPADRMARLKQSGGTIEGEAAVVKSLDWLQETQNPNGSWGKGHPVAMTGFAILVYLGHCETPLSEKYGETVLKGITYLVNNGLKNDGRLTNKDLGSIQWVYDHGIASYALAESYTFCKSLNVDIPDLDKVTKKAGDIIMQGQTGQGGWLYKFQSNGGGDNSVGFWQIQALKACKHTGLWKGNKFKATIRKALGWLEDVQGSDGTIGYRNNSARSPGLTGGGVLAFQMWGEGRSKEAKKGIKWISENQTFEWGNSSANLYYHYYHAQAMINHGGREWDDYNDMFRDKLIKAQKGDGSWSQGGVSHGPINTHMATCLAAMMLEVYYRFLPGTGSK